MKFPIYIVKSDIIPLLKQKPDGKQSLPWLNSTTIDAIVLYKDPAIKDEPPARERGAVYLGSSFNKHILLGLTEEYMDSYRAVLHAYGSIVLIYNLGERHWILLHIQMNTDIPTSSSPPFASAFSSSPPSTSPRAHATAAIPRVGSAPSLRIPSPSPSQSSSGTAGLVTVYDPMASSSLDGVIMVFASRLLNKEEDLEKSLGGSSLADYAERRVSVRAQVNRMNLSFFRLVNVGVQLQEEEGYNCGLYCALWARSIAINDDGGHPHPVVIGDCELPRYTKKQLVEQREIWSHNLSHKPHFYNLEGERPGGAEDVVVTKLLDGMCVSTT